jgi:hypothetical protein
MSHWKRFPSTARLNTRLSISNNQKQRQVYIPCRIEFDLVWAWVKLPSSHVDVCQSFRQIEDYSLALYFYAAFFNGFSASTLFKLLTDFIVWSDIDILLLSYSTLYYHLVPHNFMLFSTSNSANEKDFLVLTANDGKLNSACKQATENAICIGQCAILKRVTRLK